MTRLTIEVLGGLDIRSAGTGAVLELPTRKSKAFLAYLALSPGMLRSREHLAGTFWDRSAEEQARASLRQTLSGLRRALPKTSAPLIDADSESIWLDAEAVDVDAVRFDHLTAERSTESLERAASLYRGELLGGFSLVEEHFEHWLAAERRRLQEVAVHALSELVGRYARADQIERGIAIAERLLVLDPLLEWAHASLMRLYARGGRREAALRQYQECARILSRELGIAPAEETKRLAAEIGSESHGGGPADSAPRQPATQSLYQHVTAISLSDHDRSEPLPVLPAERKQLSVLCARIREGDSTDPESVIARIDPALKAIVDSVRRFGGTVSSVQGDGVTALFGAPYAQEDHAVRACYAALAIRDAVSSFAHKPSDMRIGIHAGEAIVRTVGDENLRHYEPVGPMVQIANHIGAVIAPGEIGLTADATRRAEGFIETSGPATKRFDGASEPIELFMLHAKTPLRLRWDARSARPLTQFVGRNAEVNRLHELLERAARGSGQVAAILGEPGMGKSRLAHEFVNSPSVSGWTVLETGTVFHDTSATYLPLANLLRTWFEIGERDAQAEAAEKLRRGVEALDPALASIVPALAAILDLPPADAQ
jgi:DNA-binding SARP family transcriptional activator/class 3 adenylate cyclase